MASVRPPTEHALAAADIARVGPLAALPAAFIRHGISVCTAQDEALSTMACKKGCSYCCHNKVSVRAHEVLLAAEYVTRNFPTEQQAELTRVLAENSVRIRALTPAQHMQTNIRCAFLLNGACSIYEVRPMKCRDYHATDVSRCIRAYEDPADLGIPDSYVPEVFAAANACSRGFQRAVVEAGYDPRKYELNTAFEEALADTGCAERYHSKQLAFRRAIVVAEGP